MSLHHMVARFDERDAWDAPAIAADMFAVLAEKCDEVHVNPLEELDGYYNELGQWVEWPHYRIVASGWIWSLN